MNASGRRFTPKENLVSCASGHIFEQSLIHHHSQSMGCQCSTPIYLSSSPRLRPNNPETTFDNMEESLVSTPNAPEPEHEIECADCVLQRLDMIPEMMFILSLMFILAAGSIRAICGYESARYFTIIGKSYIHRVDEGY